MKTETYSYIPALTREELTRQIDYFFSQRWIPGIEFTRAPGVTTAYWDWWKLPLFGAQTTGEVLAEIEACRAAHPDGYIRVTGYDSARQGQVMGFVVHRPA